MQIKLVHTVIGQVAKRFPPVNPTALTIAGSIPPLLFFVFTVLGLYPLALLVYLGNAIDMLDGAVARAQGKVTAFGGFLDSTIDRVGDSVIITTFAVADIVSWEVATALLFLSFLTSYIRGRGELASGGNVILDVGPIERPQRLIILFLGFLLYAIFPAFRLYTSNVVEVTFLVLIVLSIVTVLQRLWFAWKKLG